MRLKTYDSNVLDSRRRETELDKLIASSCPNGTRAGLHLIHQLLQAIVERQIRLSPELQTSLIDALSELGVSMEHGDLHYLAAVTVRFRATYLMPETL